MHLCSNPMFRFSLILNLHLTWGSGSSLLPHRTPNLVLGSGSVRVRVVRAPDRDQFSAGGKKPERAVSRAPPAAAAVAASVT